MDERVILSLYQGTIGNRAKVDPADVEVETDKKMLHVTKDLYDSDELRAIRHLNSEVRMWVRQRSTASPTLRPGLYLVKLGAVKEVKEYLAKRRPELRERVDAFVGAMPQRQQESKERLGALYSEADYPTPAQVKAACKWEFSWLGASAPTSLREISDAFFAREEERARKQMEYALNEIKAGIRAEMLTLLDFTKDRLAPEADGTHKQFRAPVVRKINTFLDLLRYREAGDEGVTAIANELRAAISGVDPKEVRDNAEFARAMARRFESMRTRLATLIENEPIRQIELEDEPDETTEEAPAEEAAAQA